MANLDGLKSSSIEEQKNVLREIKVGELTATEQNVLADYLLSCDEDFVIDYLFHLIDNSSNANDLRFFKSNEKLKSIFKKMLDICDSFEPKVTKLRADPKEYKL